MTVDEVGGTPEIPVLITPRLELSAGRPEDADSLFRFVHGETGRIVTDMLLWDGPEHVDEMKTYYRDYNASRQDDSISFNWVLRDRDGSITGELGRAMGSIGIRIPTPPGSAEIGYWIAPPHWRQGLMSEAIYVVSESAFQWNSSSVIADVFTSNEASQRLLEKLGFRNVEELPVHHVKRGIATYSFRYEVLPDELRAPGPKLAS